MTGTGAMAGGPVWWERLEPVEGPLPLNRQAVRHN